MGVSWLLGLLVLSTWPSTLSHSATQPKASIAPPPTYSSPAYQPLASELRDPEAAVLPRRCIALPLSPSGLSDGSEWHHRSISPVTPQPLSPSVLSVQGCYVPPFKLNEAAVEEMTDSSSKGSSKSERKWENAFEELCVYQAANGHCNPPTSSKVGSWLYRQKLLYSAGKLSQDRLLRLKEVGALSSAGAGIKGFNKTWEENFNRLALYKQRFGDCEVNPRLEKQLNKWLKNQRFAFKRSALDHSRSTKLHSLGVRWELRECWESRLKQLISCQRSGTEGHEVNASCVELLVASGADRLMFDHTSGKGKTTAEEHTLGEVEGVTGSAGTDDDARRLIAEQSWSKSRAGRSKSLSARRERDPKVESLRRWISSQRSRYHRRQMSLCQMRELERIGFRFSCYRKPEWIDRFTDSRLEWEGDVGLLQEGVCQSSSGLQGPEHAPSGLGKETLRRSSRKQGMRLRISETMVSRSRLLHEVQIHNSQLAKDVELVDALPVQILPYSQRL